MDGIYRCVFTMSRPPECLLILGPMRYSDACSPPDEQIIIEKNAKKHADHRRCRQDGCLLRYHRAERERERERGRTRETLPPSTREYAQSPILEIMSVMFRFFAKPGISRTQIHVTTRNFKWPTTTREVGRRQDGGLYEDHPPSQERQDNRRDRPRRGANGGGGRDLRSARGGGRARRRGEDKDAPPPLPPPSSPSWAPPTARARVSPSLSVD